MEESSKQLALALNIPTNGQLHISCEPVFSDKQTVTAGEFQVQQKKMIESPSGALIDVEIFDANGQPVAAGRILERTSFEIARKQLLEKLVLNSMMIESLVEKYEVLQNDIGELCIVEKTFDKVSRKYISEPKVFHFVRGCTVASLYSVAESTNITEIAKAMDQTLVDAVTLQAKVRLKPEALEVSPGILTAFIKLPEGYPVSGITSATCDGSPSERMMSSEDGTEMIIKFRRKDIEAALAKTGGSLDTQFVVRGTWQGPAGMYFFQGESSIKKILSAEQKK